MSNIQTAATLIISSTPIIQTIEVTPSLASDFIALQFVFRDFSENIETIVHIEVEDSMENVLINDFTHYIANPVSKTTVYTGLANNVDFIDGTQNIFFKVYSDRDLTFTLDLIGYSI